MVGFKFTKLVDKYHRKIHRKRYDDCFINCGDILLFKLWGKKKKKFQNLRFGNLIESNAFLKSKISTTKLIKTKYIYEWKL